MSATPTPEQIAYMQAHASDNLKVDIIVCSAICGVASLVFILARLWSRMLSQARLGWNDWIVIIGYVGTWSMTTIREPGISYEYADHCDRSSIWGFWALLSLSSRTVAADM